MAPRMRFVARVVAIDRLGILRAYDPVMSVWQTLCGVFLNGCGARDVGIVDMIRWDGWGCGDLPRADNGDGVARVRFWRLSGALFEGGHFLARFQVGGFVEEPSAP